MKRLLAVFALAAALALPAFARADHPELLVTTADRDAIKAKIENAPRAKKAFAELKTKIDKYAELNEKEPGWLSSRLMMNWQTHYTIHLTQASKYVGGEGHAPVPTPRFGGARDWTTVYSVPDKIEDFKPLNDDGGKIWMINTTNGQGEWVAPSTTGRQIEIGNERVMQAAAEAGFLYWITGDEKYARLGADPLWTYMNGFSYIERPAVNDTTSGWTSFECIHEAVNVGLGTSYDFLHDYLVKQGKDVSVIEKGFKRMADRIIDNGSRVSNWNMNQQWCMCYVGLVVGDNEAFADKRGRAYYMDILLHADLPRQQGIISASPTGFDQKTGLWPEAPGYGFGTAPQILEMATLARSDPDGQKMLADPFYLHAIQAQFELLHPNGMSIGLGDTYNTPASTQAVELLLADAQRRGDGALADRLASVLHTFIASGYDRSAPASTVNSPLLALTQYVGELKAVPAAPPATDRTFAGTPLNVLMQRNIGSDVNHSLSAAMYGTRGGHVHVNGLTLELFGAGIIQGADPGRGSSYWQPDHTEYYEQIPAHNTVIVDARDTYALPGGRGGRGGGNGPPPGVMNTDLVEPGSDQTAMSPNIGFSQGTLHYNNPPAEQQRTVAVVRTGATSGFYIDIFRSRTTSAQPTDFHDYIYHNVGQSFAVGRQTAGADAAANVPLALKSSSVLANTPGALKGYAYFKNEQTIDENSDIEATWTTRLGRGPMRLMSLFALAQADRQIFVVEAPADRASRDWAPKDLQTAPMHTVIMRQKRDAWTKPFITVFEPRLGDEPPSIQRLRLAHMSKEEAATSLAAAAIEGQISGAGPGQAFSLLFAQDDQPTRMHTFDGPDAGAFQGSFGTVLTAGGQVTELYLGSGKTIGNSLYAITAAGDGPVLAGLRRVGDAWRYSASAPVTLVINGVAVAAPAGHDMVVPTPPGHLDPLPTK